MNSTAHWVFQTRNPADDQKRRVYRWTFVPFLFVDKALQQISLFLFDYLPLYRARSLAGIRENLRMRRLNRQLLRESGGTHPDDIAWLEADAPSPRPAAA